MIADEDGMPLLGASASTLGIRVHDPRNPGKVCDIKPDGEGLVHPETGGLSVTPDVPERMYYRHRPVALGGLSTNPLFAIGADRLGPKLKYRPDPDKPEGHGFIEPAVSMKAEEYVQAISALRDAWRNCACESRKKDTDG
jgi:hypothetical protein